MKYQFLVNNFNKQKSIHSDIMHRKNKLNNHRLDVQNNQRIHNMIIMRIIYPNKNSYCKNLSNLALFQDCI